MLGLLLLAVGAGGGYWYRTKKLAADESHAAQELKALKVIVIPGAAGGVATVDLRNVSSSDDLAKALSLLDRLHRIESLNVEGTAISDEQLRLIGCCRPLTSLSLGNTAISDRGLPHLAPLTNLLTLYVDRTKVSSAGLKDIAQLKSLKILGLGSTAVADDVGPLTELPHLEWLLLSGIPITDAMVQSLVAMPNLSHLSIHECTISEQAIAQIKDAHPGIGIDQ